MASRRDEQQESARLRVMRLLSDNPTISTRGVADAVGISNGAAYYVLRALVEKGFVKKLEIHGVGFKAAVNGQLLNLNLGYSHEINHQIPAGLNVSVENNTNITIEGADKATVGKMAAEVRAYYPVEPYKGKGVRYADELVVRKQGKQVQ